METMSTGAAMDLLRKMNDRVTAGEAGDSAYEDGDKDMGWTSGMEDAGDVDPGALPGSPRVKLTERELESALAMVAQAVGGVDRLTIGDIKGLMGHMYVRGHHMGHRRGFKRAHRHYRDSGVHWGRSRRMNEFRVDIIERYKAIHGGDLIEGPGFYYGTVEAQFSVEDFAWASATGTQAAAVINTGTANPPGSATPGGSPVIDQAFNLGIGDISTTWLGGPHQLTAADTNLQNPGQNLFADELFIIEALSARVRGARVLYPGLSNTPPATYGVWTYPLAGAGGSTATVTNQALNGQCMVWDENGEMLPVELWNGLTDYYRLAHALAENTSVHFTWRDLGIGGSNVTTDALVDSFLHVPGSYEMSVRRTSGGNAQVLDLPQGYIWCLDKQFQASRDQGGNGLFDAEIHLDENVLVPFQPFSVFGSALTGTPANVAPVIIALYWEIRLLGTSLLPGRRDYRSLETRRRL